MSQHILPYISASSSSYGNYPIEHAACGAAAYLSDKNDRCAYLQSPWHFTIKTGRVEVCPCSLCTTRPEGFITSKRHRLAPEKENTRRSKINSCTCGIMALGFMSTHIVASSFQITKAWEAVAISPICMHRWIPIHKIPVARNINIETVVK